MVVLMEYAPGVGVAQKRKGVEEPGLFACLGDGDGVPISCRATKMRRLECAGTRHNVAAAAAASDVMMGEEPPALSPGPAEGERAVVVCNDPALETAPAGSWLDLLGQYRLRPWAPMSAGAESIRDMLREADSRTVRAVLSSAQEERGADLALVPWGAPPAPGGTDQASTAAETVYEEEDAEGTAAMDVEEDCGDHQAQTRLTAGRGEGFLWRWPQHCLAPPSPLPLPAVGQASPAVWSW